MNGIYNLSGFYGKTTLLKENEGLGGVILSFWLLGARKHRLTLKNLNGCFMNEKWGMSG